MHYASGMTYLAYHKIKLILLLSIETVLITLHLALTKPHAGDTWAVTTEWHFWLGLIFGYYVIYYVYTLACSECGFKQIWRSNNCMDWRMPGAKCWHCRHTLEKN